MMAAHRSRPESRHPQKKLAEKVTLLVHGKAGLDTARLTTEILYGGNPEALVRLTSEEMEVVFKSASSVSLVLNPGTSVLKVAMDAGCFRDERDARRIIAAGGLYVNLCRVNNPDLVLIPGAHILPNDLTLLKVGKRHYYLVKWLKWGFCCLATWVRYLVEWLIWKFFFLIYAIFGFANVKCLKWPSNYLVRWLKWPCEMPEMSFYYFIKWLKWKYFF